MRGAGSVLEGTVLDVANSSGTVEIATVVKTPPKEAVVEDSAKQSLVGLDNWELEVVIPFPAKDEALAAELLRSPIVSLSQPLGPDDQLVRRLAMSEA